MYGDTIFKRVLFLTDFSDYSRNAILYTINALGNRSEYHLLNCYNCRTSASTFIDINAIAHDESVHMLKEERKWITDQFPNYNLRLETSSEHGEPLDVLKEIFKHRADLIVVGGKGAGNTEHFLTGNITNSLIPDIKVPILMVPIGAYFRSIEKVALANDLKFMSKDINMEVIRALKGYFSCDITSLSVKPKGWVPNDMELRLLERLAERAFIKNKFIIENDDTSAGLITFCFENQTDLLIVISKRRGFFQRLFNRSISQKLMNQAVMPILVL